MLLTLRGNKNNLTSGGIFTWTLSESYNVKSVTLVSVIGLGSVQSGTAFSTYSQNPLLYAKFTEGLITDSYMNKSGGNQAHYFPIGLLTDFANRTSANILNNPLKIVDTISKIGTTIKIKLTEIINNTLNSDDIDEFYFEEVAPPNNVIRSLGIDFIFDIELLHNNVLTVND